MNATFKKVIKVISYSILYTISFPYSIVIGYTRGFKKMMQIALKEP